MVDLPEPLMVPRGFSLLGILFATGLALAFLPNAVHAQEDVREAARFLQGLRDRGYFDLASEYLEAVRDLPDTPAALKTVVDYELGRMLLDEAAKTGDLVRRKELLDQARTRLDAFSKAQPNHSKAPDALVELARLLVERGHLAMLQADDIEAKTEKETKLGEARGSFDLARNAYETAEKKFKESFAKFPPFIPEGDARKDEKERAQTALMLAQLQKAIVDYEQGQTFLPGSKERIEFLNKALVQFEDLYKRHRQQMAGIAARMWQGKCYEEQNELGKAMGIYNELMQHDAPQLRSLQRYVGYFRLIVLAKRKEYALAADEAVRWLQAAGPAALKEKEGLGVQLELAKDIIAQLPDAQGENEKNAALKKATDTLANVVKISSPFKLEALELLRKYKPSAAASALEVSRMNYDDAILQGEQSFASQDYDRAIPYFRQAIRRAEALRDMDKVNAARYFLARCYYLVKRYYEAEVLAEHVVRQYPRGGVSPKCAELAMIAFWEAYNTYTKIDRATDLNNLVEVAKYTAETYPELETGDTARMNLGQIYHGTGRYEKAIEAFESVRAKSSFYTESRTKIGASYWEQSQALRRDNKDAPADVAQNKAIASLKTALKARQDAANPVTDPALIGNACDLADIYLKTSKPEDALKLLDPIAKQQTGAAATGAAFTQLTSTMLRAHVGVNQTDLAMADMALLEKAGGSGASLTQLYLELGKLLEKEMESLKKKGDGGGLNRTKSAYLKFLTALAESKSGQTFESLKWAGDNMLKLGNSKQAEGIYDKILEAGQKDPSFGIKPDGDRELSVKLKLAGAYRNQGKFEKANTLISQLTEKRPKALEPLMEKGYLLEDKATAKQGKWDEAFVHWKGLAMRLSSARTKPVEYYDAWYHAAIALKSEGKSKEAKQTLASIMRLSTNVGGPEMKLKYKTLLDQIK